jgi:hypothetical protein
MRLGQHGARPGRAHARADRRRGVPAAHERLLAPVPQLHVDAGHLGTLLARGANGAQAWACTRGGRRGGGGSPSASASAARAATPAPIAAAAAAAGLACPASAEHACKLAQRQAAQLDPGARCHARDSIGSIAGGKGHHQPRRRAGTRTRTRARRRRTAAVCLVLALLRLLPRCRSRTCEALAVQRHLRQEAAGARHACNGARPALPRPAPPIRSLAPDRTPHEEEDLDDPTGLQKAQRRLLRRAQRRHEANVPGLQHRQRHADDHRTRVHGHARRRLLAARAAAAATRAVTSVALHAFTKGGCVAALARCCRVRHTHDWAGQRRGSVNLKALAPQPNVREAFRQFSQQGAIPIARRTLTRRLRSRRLLREVVGAPATHAQEVTR